MDALPDNVIRPRTAAWTDLWGDRPPPEAYRGRWLEIGEPQRLVGLGANLTALPPGVRAGPLHHHLVEEEVFLVLDGELTVRELRPDRPDVNVEYVLRAGELAVYPPGTGVAHHSWNRSGRDVTYLALSDDRAPHEICVYPDSGKTMLRGLRAVGVFGEPSADVEVHVRAANAAVPARRTEAVGPEARPPWVAGPDAVPERALGGGVFGRGLSRTAGATRVFVNRDRLAPGAVSSPLHWHTAEDELAVVLAGSPILRQVHDGVETRTALTPGDVVVWPAGGRRAHQIRNESDEDVVLAVVGTDRRDDVLVLPERDEVRVRALGRAGRLHTTDYFLGE